jgi:small-conductance mechanosensitive channel
VVTIPNGKFLTDEVGSTNAGKLNAQIVIPFFVASAEDFDRARRIVTEATATSRYVNVDRPILVLVEDKFMGERFVTQITSKAYVFDVRYELEYATDVTERVKRAFRDACIRTPDLAYRDVVLFGREVPPKLG